ncbi:helix-turn-helix domain-containing protein [Mucilaginibacter sp. KACC 22063]|uniref:helix-turn-helix domain-containing protein n=1 Tax=Mucilaginibacter sp. KACC 22063 TaxID=3025666 RepID=UPI0023654E75|nr:AraC family transcriptional regulator [Mucilaginibacter sp. KACC 22063]WDF55606.1 AraC family transcriptional regulator [Mucilaginibacter sp. KACC 22063]
MTELFIKNMVCDRCKMVVEQELNKHGLQVDDVHLGLVHLRNDIDKRQRLELAEGLNKLGFELLDDVKSKTVEQIKNSIIQKIHHSDYLDIKVNWSALLSDELNQDYKHLSGLFSGVEGITLEQYIIQQKIERVKELLFYDEMNLSEISYKLGYSSVAHLSAQFKKVTGQTPSQFKAARSAGSARRSLDAI